MLADAGCLLAISNADGLMTEKRKSIMTHKDIGGPTFKPQIHKLSVTVLSTIFCKVTTVASQFVSMDKADLASCVQDQWVVKVVAAW
jgi:hypothetical protein